MKRMLLKASLCLIGSMLFVGCAGNNQTTVSGPQETNNQNIESGSKATTQEVVKLSAGDLVGYNEGGVYTFKGIPYATAERFKSPEPIKSYENGTHMALTYGSVSPQDRTFSSTGQPNPYEFMTPSNGTADMVGNEACQYLNVWSNSLEGNKPVIVFFHGGGLNNGASSELSGYTGEYFVEAEDVVFVSVNHRLNVLGYLDLSTYGGDEYKDSGIVGIQDCVKALEWVQENIEHFGGDPSNVTIVGQSGGVEKVTTLASMSDTVGLFDKVVYMSGYYSNSSKIDGEANAKKLVDYLNLSDDEVITTLTDMNYEDLLKAARKAKCEWSTNYGTGTFTSPLFDENGNMNEYAAKRTWIVGTTYSEFNTNTLSLITEGINEENYLPNLNDDKAMEMLSERYGDNAQSIADLFAKAYPDHTLGELLYLNPSPEGGFSRYGLIDEENGILKKFNDADVKVYTYVTAYKQPYFGGVTMYHSGDIPYWFGSVDEVAYMIKGDEENAHNVSKNMVSALASFAATGDPSTESLEWKPYTAEEHNTMVFDVNSENKMDYDLELYKLIMNSIQQ